jgi:hypothetical protein
VTGGEVFCGVQLSGGGVQLCGGVTGGVTTGGDAVFPPDAIYAVFTRREALGSGRSPPDAGG